MKTSLIFFKIVKLLYIIIAVFLIEKQTSAQNISSLGSPHIQNYTKSQYKGGNQNWGITQGSDGIIYTANNKGLLTFDGAYWNIYPLDNYNYVRSVAVGPKGNIYIGGKEEFGYFSKIDGKLVYRNLSKLVAPELLENDEIWKIYFLNNDVIFQSFSKCYIYKNNKIEILHGEGEPFLFAHQVGKNFWVEKIPSGLHKLTNNTFEKLKDTISNVLTILPYDNNQFLVGTAKKGLYSLNNNGQINKWKPNSSITKLLEEAQINNGIVLPNNRYALGTIKNGIFIIDKEGNLLYHLHRRNGLQNNTILSMTLDKQGNIWAGLDNGIDRIEVNSPFYYLKNIYGELGTVYAIKIFNKHIYLGTNQGLFYSKLPQSHELRDLNLNFIPGSHGQVWTLDVINNQLVCGHNEGTFLVVDNKIKKISNYTGGWVNKPIKENLNFFIQGNYTGLALFKDTKIWSLDRKYHEPNKAVVDLIQKSNNRFWVIINKEIQLVEFSDNFTKIKLIKSYSFAKDFPNIQRLTCKIIEGNLLFLSNKGMFIFDDVLSKFKPYKDLNNQLGSFATSGRVKNIDGNRYIFASDGRFAHVIFNNGVISVDSNSFTILENSVMKNYEVIEPFGQSILFGLDNGIAIYDSTIYRNHRISSPTIKGFYEINTPNDTIHDIKSQIEIPYEKNSIRILFSSHWYTSGSIKYQYMLEGDKNEWSLLSELPYVDFTNLSYGKYKFKVRAVLDNTISEASTFEFRIKAPWYLSWLAIVFYIVVFVILTYILKRLYDRRITSDKLKIQQEFNRKQEELLRKETEQNEKKLMALKNDQLSQELELKSRELANAATNIQYKNELLNNLNEELLKLKDKDGKALSNDQLQRINKLINNAKNDERDWDLFEKSFNESHENFFKKLKSSYPSLSPNDLKLCAYLRLNMSSKDIASLISISIRGVEIRRYRLRKKFNLPSEKNLNEFLIEL